MWGIQCSPLSTVECGPPTSNQIWSMHNAHTQHSGNFACNSGLCGA